eukprot:CAMPEP_0115527644 /NCGR_PEP_ID=MMETSP0271-20121206/82956_1 /TAXON_ID=71861 /ORGANISM="Scrippsiella trochoidea, Strain CCMP3099" /LENGTH=66 /DNA_ID=CAMNT_0002959489 /DNA_START=15 /DNA_END=212 /DNA_ORIENTATION=-
MTRQGQRRPPQNLPRLRLYRPGRGVSARATTGHPKRVRCSLGCTVKRAHLQEQELKVAAAAATAAG